MEMRRICKGWYGVFDGPWSHSQQYGRVFKLPDGKWKATNTRDRVVGYARSGRAAADLLV